MNKKSVTFFLLLVFIVYIYYFYYVYLASVTTVFKETNIRNIKETTIVTAYFQIKSKYPSDHYFKWIKNFLTIKDPIIIITSSSLKDFMLDIDHHI